ncbi:MAG: outer membrane protein assembly factor BamA [Pseudomonadota bacterium]|nr:outer membrane protein assembly factor BamA [Pseudomonadota bacterium]
MIKIFEKRVFLLLFFFFYNSINAQEVAPASPSSSYNNEYYKKGIKEDEKKAKEIILPVNNQIIVQGNNRLDSSVIIRDSLLDFTKTNPKDLSFAIKNLYKTGYYENVNIFKKDNIIFINVKENPIIDQISIEGNSEISDEIILTELESKSRSVYSTDMIKGDVKKIQDIYKRAGYFSTFVDPKYIKLDQNRVNLVFEVFEGKEATVKKINFFNNNIFSDSTLRDVISTSESRWYEFWGTNDIFDRDRINYDKDLLKEYYYQNGYIDFQIISANSSLVKNKKDFIVNFTLSEGKRYKVANVTVRSLIRKLGKKTINNLLEIESGDWYSTEDIDLTIKNINEKTSELGYAFVEVMPRIKKLKNNKVDITLEIDQGSKIYIDRIKIKGNIKTEDKVIRREMELVEGDPYNSLKLKQSEKNVRSTGLFENVEIKVDEVSGTNKSSIDVEVTERSTGEFSVGAGFSSLDGALGNIGVKESNVFGQAKELSLQLGISTRRSSIDLSYTDPYFLDSDIAAGIDIFNVRRNNKTYSGYKHNILGFKLRSGYEVIDDFRHISSYTLKRDKIHDIDNDTSSFIREQEGKRTNSIIGQAFQYDKLNDRLNPTDGYRVRLDLDYYGLIGDSEHFASELKIANFYRLSDSGGIYLGTFLEAGFIASIKEVKINDRYFLNGDRMRGFKNLGIGPRDSTTADALGGEIYYIARNELNFPLGLPDELGLSGLAFVDVGTLYNTSSSSTTIKDESSLRAAAGIGVAWLSPFGPVKIFLSKAILKENYDKKEIFRFSFGTTY